MLKYLDIQKLLTGYGPESLLRLKAAGETVEACREALVQAGSNPVAEILEGQGEFFEWDHYPKGEVVDPATFSQYYYHAHPKEERPQEHGHFHTFIRFEGMPDGAAPVATGENKEGEKPVGAHLIGIAMDHDGEPIKLFTTNRWVTDETRYEGKVVMKVLEAFEVGIATPSKTANRWLTAMIQLFRLQIEALIQERDKAVASWREENPERDVFEDRRLEVISECEISVAWQIAAIEEALSR